MTDGPKLATLAAWRRSHGAGSLRGRVAGLAAALLDRGHRPDTPAVSLAVPGRVEVLGKHTDYAGGPSLVAATRQGLAVVAVRDRDRILRIVDVARGLEARVDPTGSTAGDHADWSAYFRVVARGLGPLLSARPGATIAFSSDLPEAAGMSSSSALVVAAFLALTGLEGLVDREELERTLPDLGATAGFLGAVESGEPHPGLASGAGVGTRGGSQDHTAILGSETGRIGLWTYAPVRRLAGLAMPTGHVFAIGVSGVAAAKADDARERYNRAADLAREAAASWRRVSGSRAPHLAAAIAGANGGGAEVREAIARDAAGRFPTRQLLDRFDHFARESDLVHEAARALQREDLSELGGLADRSQALATELLGNQVAETRNLVRLARELGAVAASAFGAGYGGSVWALVESAGAEDFLQAWSRRYRGLHPARHRAARFLQTGAGPGARRLA